MADHLQDVKKLPRISIFTIIRDVYKRCSEDRITSLGAEIAFFLMLSVFPFIIFISSLGSYFLIPTQDAINYFIKYMPDIIAPVVYAIAHEVVLKRSNTLISVSMFGTIWAASGGISAIGRALNKAYDTPEKRPFWKLAGISLFLTIITAIGFIVMFAGIVAGEQFTSYISGIININFSFLYLDAVRYIFSVISLFVFLIIIYHFAPSSSPSVRHCIPGAIFTAIGWSVLSFVFSYYVSNFSNFSYTYGSIGGIAALMIWLYWNSMLILAGGELNASVHFLNSRKNP